MPPIWVAFDDYRSPSLLLLTSMSSFFTQAEQAAGRVSLSIFHFGFYLKKLTVKIPTDPPTSVASTSLPSRTLETATISLPSGFLRAGTCAAVVIFVAFVFLYVSVKRLRLEIFRIVMGLSLAFPLLYAIQHYPGIFVELFHRISRFSLTATRFATHHWMDQSWYHTGDTFWVPYGLCVLSGHEWEGFASLYGNSYISCGDRFYTLRFRTKEDQWDVVAKSYILWIIVHWVVKRALRCAAWLKSLRQLCSSPDDCRTLSKALSAPRIARTLRPSLDAFIEFPTGLYFPCLTVDLALAYVFPLAEHYTRLSTVYNLALSLGPVDELVVQIALQLLPVRSHEIFTWLIRRPLALWVVLRSYNHRFMSSMIAGVRQSFPEIIPNIASLEGALVEYWLLQGVVLEILRRVDNSTIEVILILGLCVCGTSAGISSLSRSCLPSLTRNSLYLTFTRTEGWEGSQKRTYDSSFSIARHPKIIINANVIKQYHSVVHLGSTSTVYVTYICVAIGDDEFGMFNECLEKVSDDLFDDLSLSSSPYWTEQTECY
ncbi:hypothetical protein PM082_010610 [Marasmius tenuissimus]|nr:hypothetical protein PM082_010610 [Marasmius tenuissimus]